MTTNKLPDGSTWNSFKLTNVTENQTVTFTFSPDTNGDGIPDKYNIYTVTSVAEGQGSVDPSKKSVALGENVVFTVTPGEGQALYQIKIGDEVKLTNTAETPFGGTYTLENVTADTQVTFIFAVDTDGDGIPDTSETWYTVTVTHDDNIQMPVGAPEDGIYKVKAGNDITIGFEPVEGFAIDTVDVDGTDYVNNGQTEAPYSSWNEVKFEAVEANHTVHITAAETSDDTGIADKYKFTVQGIILGDPGGQQITLPPILVVYGQDATVDITQYLPEGYTVESIEVGEDTYVNDPNYGKTIAEDESAIADAASDPEATEILVAAPISQAAEIQFNHGVTFDGGNNQITKTEPGKVYTFTADSTVENVDIVSTADNTEWQSSYGIQFYTGEHTLKNATLSGGNAGIIVNSATLNLEGTIDVSGNTFGGIEVCKSSAGTQTRATMPAGVLNINGATIINETEVYGKPTIWIDGNTDEEGIVNGAEAFTVVEVPHGDGAQKHFYLHSYNTKPIRVGDEAYDTLAEAVAAVPTGTETTITLAQDAVIENTAVEIPAGKIIKLDLAGHKITGSGLTTRLITNKGTLTIIGDGDIYGAEGGTGIINNDGSLTIESGTFHTCEGVNGAAINNRAGGQLTVSGGIIHGSPRGIQNLGALTINDGEFYGPNSYTPSNESNAVICATDSTATIYGGTFEGHLNGLSLMDNAGATVTIHGGTFKSDGGDGSGAIYNGLGNTLVIEDCECITGGEAGSTVANKGSLTINGGTFQGDNTSAQVYTVSSGQGASGNASLEIGSNASVTGTFGALRVVSGTATVKGGTYTVSEANDSTPYYALFVSSSSGKVEVTVEDGTFTSPNNAARCGETGFSTTPCTLTITGGTFTSPADKDAVAVVNPGTVTISGGTYSSNVQDLLAEGASIAEQDGKFVVTAG